MIGLLLQQPIDRSKRARWSYDRARAGRLWMEAHRPSQVLCADMSGLRTIRSPDSPDPGLCLHSDDSAEGNCNSRAYEWTLGAWVLTLLASLKAELEWAGWRASASRSTVTSLGCEGGGGRKRKTSNSGLNAQ